MSERKFKIGHTVRRPDGVKATVKAFNDTRYVTEDATGRCTLHMETDLEPYGDSDNALRFNAGKPEVHYAFMFPAALAGVARTFEFGTKRKERPYPLYNFTKGAPYSQLFNCAMRHALGWWNGHENDVDAMAQGWAINNLDFAISNLMRLRQQIADRMMALDDRFKGSRPSALGYEPAAQA